jgi:predicted HicB family RNase H-like nuclease
MDLSMPRKRFRNARRHVRLLEDLDLLLLADERMRAIEAGEDRLIPLEEVQKNLEMDPDRPPLPREESSPMKYKGYTGSGAYEPDDLVFFGTVDNITDIVTFQGDTVEELETAFRDSVDVYLEMCAEDGVEPQRPCSGKFVLRITPEMHRAAAAAARTQDESLNGWITGAIYMRLALNEKRPASLARRSATKPVA